MKLKLPKRYSLKWMLFSIFVLSLGLAVAVPFGLVSLSVNIEDTWINEIGSVCYVSGKVRNDGPVPFWVNAENNIAKSIGPNAMSANIDKEGRLIYLEKSKDSRWIRISRGEEFCFDVRYNPRSQLPGVQIRDWWGWKKMLIVR